METISNWVLVFSLAKYLKFKLIANQDLFQALAGIKDGESCTFEQSGELMEEIHLILILEQA